MFVAVNFSVLGRKRSAGLSNAFSSVIARADKNAMRRSFNIVGLVLSLLLSGGGLWYEAIQPAKL